MQKLFLNINIHASVKPLTLMKKERAQTSVLWKLKSRMRKGLCKKIILFLLDWYIWKEKSTINKTLKSHEHLFRSEIQAEAIVKDPLTQLCTGIPIERWGEFASKSDEKLPQVIYFFTVLWQSCATHWVSYASSISQTLDWLVNHISA